MEHVTLRPDGGVAGAEVEGADRDVLRPAAVDECLDPRLRVRRVGEAHRRLRVAERPARRQRRAARQPQESRRHVRKPRPGHHVKVEVAALRLVAAEQPVVVVVPRAQVEGGGVVVVQQPVGGAGRAVLRQQERPVLVERVAGTRVVAERVPHRDPQPPPMQVERAGLVAQAVVTVVRVPGEVVGHRRALAGQHPRHARTVRQEHPAVRTHPDQAERVKLDADGEGLRSQRQPAVAARDGGRPGVLLHPVPPVPRHVGRARRRHHPGPLLPRHAAAQEQHARQVPGQQADPAGDAVPAVQDDAVRGLSQQAGAADGPHQRANAAPSAPKTCRCSGGRRRRTVSPDRSRVWPGICSTASCCRRRT